MQLRLFLLGVLVHSTFLFARIIPHNILTPYEPTLERESLESFCHWDAASGNFVGQPGVVADAQYDVTLDAYVAKGGGCINRPIREVWAVFQSTEGLAWSASDVDIPIEKIENPTYTFVFKEGYIAGPFDFGNVGLSSGTNGWLWEI